MIVLRERSTIWRKSNACEDCTESARPFQVLCPWKCRFREAVEDVQGFWSALPDRVKERRPHVGTDVFEAGAPFWAELLEERQKGVGFPVGPAPEKAPNPCIQLVDQREVFVALEDGNLVGSELGDALQRAVLQAVVHHVGDGPIHTVPTCPEHPGRFAPGQSPGPASQKELVVVGQLFFSRSPG